MISADIRRISFIFLSLLMLTLSARAGDQERQSLWLSAPSGLCKKGAVVLVHGLNLKPGAMDEFGQQIAESGVAVYRLALPGHRGEGPKQRQKIQGKDLTQSLVKAAALVRQNCPGPLYAVGYSLGGLLTVVAQGEGLVAFDKMLLISPALALKSYTHLVTWLFPFFNIIPSRGPVAYRASEDGTSEALYRALFKLHRRAENLDEKGLLRLTRVYLNPDDELVSWSGTAKYIVEHNLETSWSLHRLDNEEAELNRFDHLGIDSKTLSPNSWNQLNREARALFGPSTLNEKSKGP